MLPMKVIDSDIDMVISIFYIESLVPIPLPFVFSFYYNIIIFDNSRYRKKKIWDVLEFFSNQFVNKFNLKLFDLNKFFIRKWGRIHLCHFLYGKSLLVIFWMKHIYHAYIFDAPHKILSLGVCVQTQSTCTSRLAPRMVLWNFGVTLIAWVHKSSEINQHIWYS